MAKEKDEKTKAQDEAQADAKQLANQQDPTKQALDDIHAQQFRQAGQDFDDLDNRQDERQGQYNPLAIGIAPQTGSQNGGLQGPNIHDPSVRRLIPGGSQGPNFQDPGVQRPIDGGLQGPNVQGPAVQDPLQGPNQHQGITPPDVFKGVVIGAGATLGYQHRDQIKDGISHTVDKAKGGMSHLASGVKDKVQDLTKTGKHTAKGLEKAAGKHGAGLAKDASKVSKVGKVLKKVTPIGAAAGLAMDLKAGKMGNAALDAVGMVPGPVGFAADAASLAGAGDKLDKGLKGVNHAGRSIGSTMQKVAQDSVKQSKNFAPTVGKAVGKTAQTAANLTF